MENSPVDPEDKDKLDDKTSGKESNKKKKKKAEALGVFAVEPKSSEAKHTADAEDIWRTLTLTKRKGGQSEAAVPLVELDEATIAQTPEASETDAPLETLSPEETNYITREIVTTQQNAAVEQPTEDGETAASKAIALFRNKILAGGQQPEQAFAETLEDLGAEPDQATNEAAKPNETVERSTEPQSEDSEAERPIAGGSSGSPPGQYRPPADGGHTFDAGPAAPASPFATEKEGVPYYNNEEIVGAAFLGGLVGYLIGRRRGRIKTQKKLLPIQKKLEKQVTKLEQDIQQKEFYIRKVARDKLRDDRKTFQMEQAHKKTEQSRSIALEANQLHGKVAPESIGRVLITADDQEAAKPAKYPEKPKHVLTDNKKIETLSRSELLDLSEKVAVENTTLRQVYETHLVSEQGLRRLMGEYLRGGDVQKALRSELVEHEIDFERDPVLRDHDRSKPSAAGNSPTLGSLLQQAGVPADSDHDDNFTRQAKKIYKDEPQDQDHHRRFMDVALIGIIFILLLLVGVLALSRR